MNKNSIENLIKNHLASKADNKWPILLFIHYLVGKQFKKVLGSLTITSVTNKFSEP